MRRERTITDEQHARGMALLERVIATLSGLIEKAAVTVKGSPFKLRLWFTFTGGVEVYVKVNVVISSLSACDT
jgi:hypothetical protein